MFTFLQPGDGDPPSVTTIFGTHSRRPTEWLDNATVRGVMFYWFMKGTEKVRVEAREVSPIRFELTVTGPDHQERVEQFTTAEALHARQVVLERELEADGWAGPHGWHI